MGGGKEDRGTEEGDGRKKDEGGRSRSRSCRRGEEKEGREWGRDRETDEE